MYVNLGCFHNKLGIKCVIFAIDSTHVAIIVTASSTSCVVAHEPKGIPQLKYGSGTHKKDLLCFKN